MANKYNQDSPGTDEFQIVDVSSKNIKLKWVTGYSTFFHLCIKSGNRNNGKFLKLLI